MKTYTVIGLYMDDEPLVAGVVEGNHQCVDTDYESSGFQRWATSVYAPNPDAAEAAAIAELTDY